MYQHIFKRIMDFVIALLGLILMSPIFLLIILGLCIVNKKNGVFFLQDRPGKNAKIFKIIKFKTMRDMYDESGYLLPDNLRLTKIGKILRSTSIDELPQLINVLKGDMSLIGPRPLLVQYLPLYNAEQARRHEVQPGITGWAQCHGRNAISWQQKFALDVWYVDHCSFYLDIKIMIMTLYKVLTCSDIHQKEETTTHFFHGNT